MVPDKKSVCRKEKVPKKMIKFLRILNNLLKAHLQYGKNRALLVGMKNIFFAF